MGGDVAGEEFEARGEAHDEEKKLDEAALVATAAAAKRNLPPIWPPGSREGNVAKWDACRRVLDEAELAADLAEAELAAAGGACTSRRNTNFVILTRAYGCTTTRNRAVAEHETARPRNSSSSSEKEERSFDGSLFRQRPPASGQPKAGARDKHTVEIFVDTGIHSWVGIPLRS